MRDPAEELTKQRPGKRPKQSSAIGAISGRRGKTNLQSRSAESGLKKAAQIHLSKVEKLSHGNGCGLKERLRAEPDQGPSKFKGYLRRNKKKTRQNEQGKVKQRRKRERERRRKVIGRKKSRNGQETREEHAN